MGIPKINLVGKKFKTNNCGLCIVINYISSREIYVQFPTGYVAKTHIGALRQGSVKDPMYPSVEGVGYIGVGKFSRSSTPKLYELWRGVLKRSYNKKWHKAKPTYKNCIVVRRWHSFQNFCADIIKMPNWNTPGFELDKDLRILGNKKYGPKYCSFVPSIINTSLNSLTSSGVSKFGKRFSVSLNNQIIGIFDSPETARLHYVSSKNKYLQKLARKYKSVIHPQVFATLKAAKI